jgi:hypothetical protein
MGWGVIAFDHFMKVNNGMGEWIHICFDILKSI